MAKFARHCACGGSLLAQAKRPGVVDGLAGVFEMLHGGPDCGPATVAEAAKARRRAYRKEARRRT